MFFQITVLTLSSSNLNGTWMSTPKRPLLGTSTLAIQSLASTTDFWAEQHVSCVFPYNSADHLHRKLAGVRYLAVFKFGVI